MNPYITPDLYQFLSDLSANNNRDWFNAHKDRYEQVYKEPLIQFITDFGPLLSQVSPVHQAVPKAQGGSLYRIYRDTRFSHNKLPYKTWAALRFRHASGQDGTAPGFYLHLAPGNTFVAMGLWHPERDALRAVRTAIDEAPETWHDTKRAVSGLEWAGESLKRAPKGVDPAHPDIVDLRRKDFILMRRLQPDDVFRPDILPFTASVFEEGLPLVHFLMQAVETT